MCNGTEIKSLPQNALKFKRELTFFFLLGRKVMVNLLRTTKIVRHPMFQNETYDI